MGNYAIILRNLRTRDNCARKRFTMTVHDPRDIPATPTTGNPATDDANITALLRLAGKTDLQGIDDLRAALMNEIDLVRKAIYLLTSTTDQPASLNFDQLFPQAAIDAYLDSENHPLPGADPKICGLQTHMVEIPYDDPVCTPAARRDFLQHMLIPQARERVTEVLRGIFPPNIYAQLGPDHCALLSELSHRLADTKLSHFICQTPPFNGSPCFAGPMPKGAINPPYAMT